jgi:hypothetical protein
MLGFELAETSTSRQAHNGIKACKRDGLGWSKQTPAAEREGQLSVDV